jgi:hypothetical protein
LQQLLHLSSRGQWRWRCSRAGPWPGCDGKAERGKLAELSCVWSTETANQEGEWMRVDKKFYSRIRPMNPISLVHLRKLLLPSLRSHWSATEPRSKTQPTATAHTQRKHTRHGCW